MSGGTRQTTDATRRKADIIGKDAAAIEGELPYDTSKSTGKLAAALITGQRSCSL